MLALLLALCLLTGPPIDRTGQTVFQARTVASPSGAWSLYVVPVTTNGLWSADYRLSAVDRDHLTRVVWKGRHEYTLRDPIVTDRGWVYGWAIVHPLGEDRYAQGGTVRIVALNTEGMGVVDAKLPESPPSPYCMGDWQSRPLILQVVPMEDSHTMAVIANRGEPGNFENECWIYDFAVGRRTAGFVPFPHFPDGQTGWTQTTRYMSAVPVRAAPLLLVQGWAMDWHGRTDGDETYAYRGRWAVFDVSGKRVFELDDADDRGIKNYRHRLELGWKFKGRLESRAAGQFSFFVQRTGETVTKRVRKTDAGEWVVVEDAALPTQ